jgi:hypothetical protein
MLKNMKQYKKKGATNAPKFQINPPHTNEELNRDPVKIQTYDGRDHGSFCCRYGFIVVMQQPYLAGDSEPYYTAIGKDSDGVEYVIEWPAVDLSQEDESEACDWNVYKIRRL